jgi:beta-lactamase regulating signal transducer with metallopeptidase domain
MTAWRAAGLAALAGVVALCVALPTTQTGCLSIPGGGIFAASCMNPSAGLRSDMLTAALVAALALTFTIIASILRHAFVHHRLSSALAGLAEATMLADQPVGLVPGIAAPAVAGLRRPTIYCSEDLAVRLDADEVHAVLLHERHHQLAFAPARLVVLSGLAPIVGRVGVGRSWLERQRAGIEIAADEYAVRSGAGRSAIARALLKLEAAGPLGSLAGFATAHELRLRALLHEPLEVSADRGTPGLSVFLAVMAVAVVCLVLPVG